MKCALIKNGKVDSVKELTEEEYFKEAKSYELIIDITEIFPEPSVGWELQGNRLVFSVDEDKKTDLILDMRFKFGNRLADDMVKKMSKVNLKLIAQGQTLNINTVVSNFVGVEAALRKCAIPTAKSAITSLLAAYPEYTEEFNHALSEINNYLASEALI